MREKVKGGGKHQERWGGLTEYYFYNILKDTVERQLWDIFLRRGRVRDFFIARTRNK